LSSQLLAKLGVFDDLLLLERAQDAWRSGNRIGFDEIISQLSISLEARNNQAYRPNAVRAERQYLRWDPFYHSQILCGLAFLVAMLGLLWKPRFLQACATSILWSTAIIQTVGLGTRMFIVWRPPVTNLYETFLFTSWACVLLGLAVRHLRSRELGNLVASFSGIAMLLLSNKYEAEGDTLKVLVAVLDSNFWLSTHVITITLGYAGVVAAGVVAHVHLIQTLGKNARTVEGRAQREDSFKSMMGILAFGLTMSLIGTVLGGIWADQSWGRFWGWDPKENGALLIVLWCAIIYHAKMAGMVRRLGAATLTGLGIIVVMLAWFGINLLGVGLHSYGFTEGAAFWLLFYCGLQVLILLGLMTWARLKGHRI
jgi:ABC-type transport system involved in cytochrome c biogenesis permease subunit